MKTHYTLLDLLRFLAAFWVMNFHYFLGTSGDLHWYRYGNFGVQLFFIISGFVIVLSLKNKTIEEFINNRFIRLFPIFWIICSVTYLLTIIIPNSRPRLFAEYLSSMTMLGDQFNGYAGFGGLIDASYWTLAIELIFYIAIGIFVFIFSYRHIRYFLSFWLLSSILAITFHFDDNFYSKLGLFHHASYFVFGGSLALIISNQARNIFERYFDWGLLFGSAIYSTLIVHIIYPHYLNKNPIDIYIVTIINMTLFIIVGILVKISNKIKNPQFIKCLLVLGGLTYPLYLLHQTIGTTVINFLSQKNIISINSLTIIFEIFIVMIAYFVYIYDKKMRDLLQKMIDK